MAHRVKPVRSIGSIDRSEDCRDCNNCRRGNVLKQVCMLLAGCLWIAPALSQSVAENPPQAPITSSELIDALGLEGHVEGGYFRRTYEATTAPRVDTEHGSRFSMTSIFYLLTREGPVGHFHLNRSDIVHYFQSGDPIDYFLIHRDGHLEQVTMGPDPRLGHVLQLTVAGGVWKASRLHANGRAGFGLISEAVSPGFDYNDMTLGVRNTLKQAFPEHAELITELSRQ
ncbi:MAG: cupin domain-containing protein [Pseudomonadota bacterium]